MSDRFEDSKPYAKEFASPQGPGDARPTAFRIVQDNDVVGKMSDKVVLLTGGSGGLGVEQAQTLGRTGAKVFFTSRDLAKGEKVRDELLKELKSEGVVAEPAIEVIQMDLTDLKSVKAGAEEFMSKSDRLNILVCNAGVAATPHKIVNGYELQFITNHLSHFYLFQLLKPLLIKASSPTFNSRVVSVSSLAHGLAPVQLGDYNFEKRGYDPMAAYAQSKTANIWFANELDRRYGGQGVHALSLHPGGIASTGLQASHDPALIPFMEQAMELPHVKVQMMNVEQGAATPVLAAVGKEYEGRGGIYLEDCQVAQPLPADGPMGSPGYAAWAYDPEREKQLWQDSLAMLGLQDD